MTVVAFHTNLPAVPLGGPLAVWGFFVISGYLVSKILYGHYRNSPGDFVMNRFLRIYPIYWAVLALGFTLLVLMPEYAQNGSFKLFLPGNEHEWFWNLTLLGASADSAFKWTVAPAWSLAVELNWYFIFFVSSFLPKRWLIIFLTITLATPLVVHFGLKKSVISLGSGYCFALGALAYHLKQTAPRFIQLASLALLPLFLFVLPRYYGLNPFEFDRTLQLLHFLIVPLLLFIAMPWLCVRSEPQRLPQFLGDLSYPLFLSHCYVIHVCTADFGMDYSSWTLFGIVAVVSLLLSCALLFSIERPIARIRTSIRNRSNALEDLTN
jgi:peptidoglycan/LPS O-acetylase OafA/YrhL